ncbi:MAG: hypothetical protein NVS2B16_26930 [Chloroflexota bacterium]
MRLFVAYCTVTAIALSATGARADWQYTKWGMSPEQFARASHGAASVVPFNQKSVRDGKSCLIQGGYQTDAQNYKLTGCFVGQDLALIVLNLPHPASPSDMINTVSALTAKYGQPTNIHTDHVGSLYTWIDQQSHNQIQASWIGSINMLDVYYTPIKVGSGL